MSTIVPVREVCGPLECKTTRCIGAILSQLFPFRAYLSEVILSPYVKMLQTTLLVLYTLLPCSWLRSRVWLVMVDSICPQIIMNEKPFPRTVRGLAAGRENSVVSVWTTKAQLCIYWERVSHFKQAQGIVRNVWLLQWIVNDFGHFLKALSF